MGCGGILHVTFIEEQQGQTVLQCHSAPWGIVRCGARGGARIGRGGGQKVQM